MDTWCEDGLLLLSFRSLFAIEMIKEARVTRYWVGGGCLFLESKLLLASARLGIRVTLYFFFGHLWF